MLWACHKASLHHPENKECWHWASTNWCWASAPRRCHWEAAGCKFHCCLVVASQGRKDMELGAGKEEGKSDLGGGRRMTPLQIQILCCYLEGKLFCFPRSIWFVWLPTNMFSLRFLQYWGRIGSENNMTTCHRPTCRKEGVLLDYSTDGGKCLF